MTYFTFNSILIPWLTVREVEVHVEIVGLFNHPKQFLLTTLVAISKGGCPPVQTGNAAGIADKNKPKCHFGVSCIWDHFVSINLTFVL